MRDKTNENEFVTSSKTGQHGHNITITCPCSIDPLSKSHFYKVKLSVQGYTFFLIFALKHRLWVLFRTGGSNVYPRMF